MVGVSPNRTLFGVDTESLVGGLHRHVSDQETNSSCEESGTPNQPPPALTLYCPCAYYQGRSTEPRDSNPSVYVHVCIITCGQCQLARGETGVEPASEIEGGTRRGEAFQAPHVGRSCFTQRQRRGDAGTRCWSRESSGTRFTAPRLPRRTAGSPPHAEGRESGHASPYIGSQ